MNDVPIGRDGSNNVTTAPWTAGSVNIVLYDGSQTAVHAALSTAFPGWNANYIGLKHAYAVIVLDPTKAGNPFESGIPDFTFDVFGFRLFDPRDGTQSATDQTTWKYSDNPALASGTYLVHKLGMNFTADSVDWTSVATAADVCDAARPLLAGGTEKTFTCCLRWRTDERHEEVLAKLGAAMLGGTFFVGDKWRVFAGHFDASTAETVTIDTYAGQGLSYSEYRPIAEIVNGVRGTFSSPFNAFEKRDFPAYQDAAAVVQDGYEWWLDLDLEAVSSPAQAQYIARVIYRQKRYGFPAVLQTKIDHFDVIADDVLKVTDTLAGWSAKTFRVHSESLDPETFELTFEMEHETAEMWAWAGTDEKPYTTEPSLAVGSGGSSGSGYVATRDLTTVPLAGGALIDSAAGTDVTPQIELWASPGLEVRATIFTQPGAAGFSGETLPGFIMTAASGQTASAALIQGSASGALTMKIHTCKVETYRPADGQYSAAQTIHGNATDTVAYFRTLIDGKTGTTAVAYKFPAPPPPSVTAASGVDITVTIDQITSTARVTNLELLVNTTNDPNTATIVGSGANGVGGASFTYAKPAIGQTRYFWGRAKAGAVLGPVSPVLVVSFT
jgi:hypothetical protein